MAKCLLIILLTVLFSCSAFAQEIDNVEDKARLGLAQSYSNLEKFNDAIVLFERLHSKYPKNKAVSIGHVRALAKTDNIDRALDMLSNLVDEYPDDTVMRLELSQMLVLCY